MITAIQGIIIIFMIVMVIFRFKIGLALYLAYLMLVPYMNVNFSVIPLQCNFINVFILLFSLYKFKSSGSSLQIDYRPLIPFIIYFVVSLIMMLLQYGVPLGVELNKWRIQIMRYLILPFVLWNQMRFDNSSIKLYRNTTIICIAIASLYGLILTSMPGFNPYIMLIADANGETFNSEYALAFNSGRIFGRISSVFTHPMLFGLFLGLSLIYIYNNRENINKYLFIILFIIIGLNIMLCGVRSVIGGVGISVIYFLLYSKNYKLILITGLICLVVYNIILSIPDYAAYLGSIADFSNKKQAVGGSSIEMRLEQFDGCLKEIKDCLFVGKGFAWTDYYHERFGDHPVMLAFESLIFVVLCNGGICGLVLWCYMVYRILKYNSKYSGKEYVLLNALLIFYLSYSCITGEYGYMQYFILFYILILGEKLYKKDNIN